MTAIIRLVMHHSAGSLSAGAVDLTHYHRVVDGEGKVHQGKFGIEANALGRKLVSGSYAAHTLNLNSGAIGVAMSCMKGAEWASPRACAAFPRPAQVEAFVAEVARLCALYAIPVTRKTVLTHAEVQTTLGVTQNGKWDFDYDPFGVLNTRDPVKIGDMLRERIASALPMRRAIIETPTPPARPVLARGATGAAVEDLHLLLGLPASLPDIFGPLTDATLRAFQKSRQLLVDGIAGPATWTALTKGT